MHGCQRAADIRADHHRLAGAERPLRAHEIVQRPALHQLHRDADFLVQALGGVDAHHVRVIDLGEQPRFPQRVRRVDPHIEHVRTDHLQRQLDVELPIVRAVHRAVRTVSDLAADHEGAPLAGHRVAQPRQGFDHPELVHHRRGFRIRLLRLRPIDRDAVGDRRGHRHEPGVLSALVFGHEPSPRPGAPVRGSPPCARRQRWVCPAPRPLRRATGPSRCGR